MVGGDEGDLRQDGRSPGIGTDQNDAARIPTQRQPGLPPGPLTAPTIQLPAVQPRAITPREPTAADAMTVRAVAKRAAAALPALGPASTRADRAARAGAASNPPYTPGVGAVENRVEVSTSVTESTAGRHAFRGDAVDASEGVGEVAEQAQDEQSEQDSLPEATTEMPVRVTASAAPEIAETAPAVDGEVEEGWIPPADPEVEAGSVAKPRHWFETGRSTPRPAGHPHEEIPRSPAYAAPSERAADLARPGPVVLEEDTWDAELPVPEVAAGEYAGRRRERPQLRTWLGIAAAIVVLAAAVGLPFLLNSPSKADSTPRGLAPAENGDLVVPGDTGPDGQLGVPASAGPVSPSVAPTPSTGASAGAKPSNSATKPGSAPKTNNNPPPPAQPFAPLTLQAESASLAGSAEVLTGMSCTGGARVVTRIGNWNLGSAGAVTFTVAVPTAGRYQLALGYAVSADNSRNAQIIVNNGSTQTLSFGQTSFAGCVVATRSGINVTLNAGSNTIRIANPSGRAPSIDRIVVSRA